MFPNTDKPLLQIPEAEEDIMDGLDDDEVGAAYIPHEYSPELELNGWFTMNLYMGWAFIPHEHSPELELNGCYTIL